MMHLNAFIVSILNYRTGMPSSTIDRLHVPKGIFMSRGQYCIRDGIIIFLLLLHIFRFLLEIGDASFPHLQGAVSTKTILSNCEKANEESAVSVDNTVDGPINFHLHSDEFVDAIADCFTDKNCNILYYHFGKSGGSDIEDKMFGIFPPAMGSCCGADLMKQFNSTPKRFCRAKFSSYQVPKETFLEQILPTCMNMTNTRALVLASFREPIRRGLSDIHQLCNKNIGLRTPEVRSACERCSYERDREFWDNRMTYFNKQYLGLLGIVTAQVPNTTVLTIESVDLSLFYSLLNTHSPGNSFDLTTRSNPEEKSLCSFGFTSDMMRGLRLSEDVYRSLALNSFEDVDRIRAGLHSIIPPSLNDSQHRY